MAFWRTLTIGLGLCAAYAVLPASWTAVRHLVIYPAGGLVAAASVVVGVRRYRPAAAQAWILIGAALCSNLIADVIWGVYLALGSDPFPSLAEPFYLAVYPLIAAGLVVAIIERGGFRVDARALIDAGLVTVVSGFLAWIYVIEPVLNDEGLSTYETIVTILYPLGDLLLLAVAARFLMGSSSSGRALRMVVAGLGLLLVGDILFALNLDENTSMDRVSDVLLLAGVVFIGVAALDPTMRALTEEGGDPGAQPGRMRAILVACLAVAPALVLVIQEVRDEPLHVWANAVASLLLIALVVLRFNVMASQAQRAADQETALSRYAAELLASEDGDEIIATAERALALVASDGHFNARVVLHFERAACPSDTDIVIPVTVRGEQVGVIVAQGKTLHLRSKESPLRTIASQLSIALERERLLVAEREVVESLAEQNEQLRELRSMQDRFVSSVSHELRTPLTSMVGYLEILHDGEVGELGPDQEHVVEIIARNCDRLNSLIGDILVAARLDSGVVKLDKASIDLAQLASNQVESIQAVAVAKGLDVQLMVHSSALTIRGDETRLGQLLDNLLSNAVKFTPDGGSVSVELGRHDEMAWLEVHDTGIGMPADEVGKVFDRFYRTSTANTIQGTGLGLWIAKSIAEAHGGSLTVSSELGVGSTFRVELPLPAPHDSPTSTRTEEVPI